MTREPDRAPERPASRGRRRSKAIRLTIVGGTGGLAALLAGCSSNDSWHRNVYRSVDDCAQDYSRGTCFSDGSQRGLQFLGPVYRMVNGRPAACRSSDRGAGPTWNTKRVSVENVVRGGFGTSCPSRGRWWSSSGGG